MESCTHTHCMLQGWNHLTRGMLQLTATAPCRERQSAGKKSSAYMLSTISNLEYVFYMLLKKKKVNLGTTNNNTIKTREMFRNKFRKI